MNVGDDMYDFADEQPKARAEHDAIGSNSIPIAGAEIQQIDGLASDGLSTGDLISDEAVETRHVGEFSLDLHGKSHPDTLYRAAGGASRDHSGVVFGCPCCGRSVGRVLRVRATVRSAWMAMCAMCAASTLERNPEAMIGGVVRASRKRRGAAGRGDRAAG